MKKILFVRTKPRASLDGASQVTDRNLRFFRRYLGDNNVEEFRISSPTFMQRIVNLFFAQSYGDKPKLRKLFVQKLSSQEFDFIYFDRSIFGSYVKIAKKHSKKTIVFLHNIEEIFYQLKYKYTHSPIDFLIYLYVKRNEKKAIDYGDYLITISERDRKLLYEMHSRDSILTLPLSYHSHLLNELSEKPKERYCLFVGSDLYANQEGMLWFVQKVLPSIDYKLYVVGKICNNLQYLSSLYSDKVRLLGYVDDLDEVYKNAECVVSPIFNGSGIKTKTIEALMYGKVFVGTAEAFAGIDIDSRKLANCEHLTDVSFPCEKESDFIQSLNFLYLQEPKYSYAYSLDFFSANFSEEVLFDRFVDRLKINRL